MNSAAQPSADLAWSSPATPRGSSLAGKAYWAMVRRLVLTAACIDVGYIALFMWLGSWPLALVNVGSIALYLAAYALIRHRKNAWGLTLIWLEVAAHTALGSLLIGWESGFHYYLLLFVPAIVVANAGRYAVPLVVALLAYYLGLWALCNHLGTLAPLAGKGQQIVNWIHICIAFALSAALAGHYRRTVVIAERKLLKMATLDGLTGLYNRSHFQSQARHALAVCERTQEPVALLLCDIDHFKQVNDTHGHAVGDQVLQAVSQRMAKQLGLNTAMARISSNAFGLLGPQELVNGERIRTVFAEPFTVAGERLQLSATTGLVRLEQSRSLGSELLLDAQIALKRAKLQHRGSSQYFSAEMGVDARERFKLLKGLRASFEEKRLFVVYQPQVDLATQRPIGAEALLRWRTADGKFVPPDQFIPLAEQSGLIIPIGEFVLRTACFQLQQLRAAGFAELRMAVNISLAQFRHPAFIPTLQRALGDAQVPGTALELEITESMAMEDVPTVLRVLAEIRSTGASVAIDDFGTGFSSLSQLRRLDVERLKIDRAFVQEAQNSAAGATIAQMVVNLGCSLGMRVVAEGIETEEQRQHLLALGCHEGQGYYFARPMPAEDLEPWLAARLSGG